VHALVPNDNIEEQVQASVNGGETSVEVEPQKLIDKIQEQEVVAPK
jgi:hypothetical protein